MVLADPELIGTTRKIWLPVDDEVDSYFKAAEGAAQAAAAKRFKSEELEWIGSLQEQERLEVRFNRIFFTAGDSRDPEMAGILAAAKGSFFMLLVTMLIAFPAGVAAAIYLEEFAPRNRWIDLIEVNINNLAAVPSIIFGLLGLAFFINFLAMPRSAPLVGGLVLALMTLPTIIIASRSAIKAVPPSIRDAALGLGASRVQTVTHHVLPLALPGMLTGRYSGHGARAGRNGATADDWHGSLRGRYTPDATGSVNGAAGADLPLGRQSGACICGTHQCGDHRADAVFVDDECGRCLVAQSFRASLVGSDL